MVDDNLKDAVMFHEEAKKHHDQDIAFYEMTRDKDFKRYALMMKVIEMISSDTKDCLLAGSHEFLRGR